jgi:hypothetical protein
MVNYSWCNLQFTIWIFLKTHGEGRCYCRLHCTEMRLTEEVERGCMNGEVSYIWKTPAVLGFATSEIWLSALKLAVAISSPLQVLLQANVAPKFNQLGRVPAKMPTGEAQIASTHDGRQTTTAAQRHARQNKTRIAVDEYE